MAENEKLIAELQEKFVMIRKSNIYRFVGGFLAVIISVFGISYYSINSAITSRLSQKVINNLDIKIKSADLLISVRSRLMTRAVQNSNAFEYVSIKD